MIAALGAKDSAAALLAALAWWRATPAPAIADLVDAISQRVSGIWVRDEQAWAKLARTRDPLVLGRLLAGVPELTASFLPTAGALLEAFEPDPRIAGAIARWTLDPPTTSSSTYPFWTKVLAIVVATGDVRAAPVIAKRLAMPPGTSQFWPKLYAALQRVRTALARLPAPGAPDPALAALVARVAKLPMLDERRASGIVASRAKPRQDPALTGPLLAQASAHLAADRAASAIDVLVVHWRASRVPEVADLIDRANRLLPAWDRPLAASANAMQAAWEQAFAEPSTRMPQLLENLTVGPAKQLELRLVDLANLGDDPRISMRLAQLARGCSVSPQRAQFWRGVFELLARHRDVRTAAPLRREFGDFASRYYDHHRQGKRYFGPFAATAEAPTLDAADAKLAAKLDAQLATAERAARMTERTLLAAIGEAPADDGPRTVYADWLIEQGHPRGELINTALTGRAPAFAPHVFGPLDDLGTFELDRGLPTTLALAWDLGALLLRELAAHPLLAIVETIATDPSVRTDARGPTAADYATVLAAAPRLARLEHIEEALADEIAVLTDETFVRRGEHLVRQR